MTKPIELTVTLDQIERALEEGNYHRGMPYEIRESLLLRKMLFDAGVPIAPGHDLTADPEVSSGTLQWMTDRIRRCVRFRWVPDYEPGGDE